MLAILDKNASDLEKETELLSTNIDFMPYYGAYKQSLADWNKIVEKQLADIISQQEKLREQARQAYIERKKFQTLYDAEIKRRKDELEAKENKAMDELASMQFNIKKMRA